MTALKKEKSADAVKKYEGLGYYDTISEVTSKSGETENKGQTQLLEVNKEEHKRKDNFYSY